MTTGRGLMASRLLAAGWPSLFASYRHGEWESDDGWIMRTCSFSGVSDFKKLHVWQKAHALSLCVDRISKEIRGARYSSLRNQIFRAATSIPANIAEGRRQESEKEFARFLRYALNSSSELEYHLILALDTQVISEADFRSLATQTIRVRKMLYALLKVVAPNKHTPPAQSRANETASAEPPAGTPSAPGR